MTSSLTEMFFHQAGLRPGAPFLTDTASGESLSYADTAQRAEGLAQTLRRAGVADGDRVVLVLQNSWPWPVAFLGCALAGAIVVPFNTRWSPAEIRAALHDCAPALVITDDRGAAALRQAAWDGPVLPASAFPARGPAARLALPEPGQVGAITYTSGTTGAAKGVMLTHRAMLQASQTYAALFGSSPLLRTAVVVPLFHNTGFIDGLGHTIVAGGHLDLYRRFDTATVAGQIGQGGYTYLIGAPTMYTRMLGVLENAAATPGVTLWLAYGGAAMPPATLRSLRARLPGARLVNCYGLSEATSITHYLPYDMGDGRLDAVGIPAPGTLDRLSNLGELEVNSPTVMAGYWNNPAATASRLRHGWLSTGDCARRSPDGVITITGRVDDLINRGGEKIAPYEVEAALGEIPGILEAVVVGLPDDDLGEIPVALVVAGGDAPAVRQGTIRRALAGRLADYKIPMRVFSVPELPKNAGGKVLRARAAGLARTLLR